MTVSFDIRPVETADADALADCFRRCYGDSYAVSYFYDPCELGQRLTDGRLRSMVAVSGDGEIVGHMGLVRPHTDALSVELGNAIVDPRYRRHGLLARLGSALVTMCRESAAVGYHHSQTTAHTIIQKAAEQAGGIETGVMLGYIPQGTDYRDLGGPSGEGRLAVVTVYQPLAAAPARSVYLPARLATLVRDVYTRAGLRRDIVTSAATVPASLTELRVHAEARRGLLRIDVERVGADLSDRADELMRAESPELIHVDLPLSDPGVPEVADGLRAHGFFFCALLPEYGTSDVLRLQRLGPDAWVRPDLVTPHARAILEAALADRAGD